MTLCFSDHGRNIQPLPCQDKSGDRGVCMFAWNCAEAGGTHLGTCVDRFYFGSCCKLPDVISPDEIEPSINDAVENNPDVGEALAAPALVNLESISTSTENIASSTDVKVRGCVILERTFRCFFGRFASTDSAQN